MIVQEKPALSTARVLFITIALTAMIATTFGFGRYLFRVVLPEMRADIGFNYATAGVLNALLSSGYLLFAFIIPGFTKRIGATRIILLATLLAVAALFWMASATAVWVVGLMLFLLGISSAGSWVPMVAVVSRFAPREHQVKILGLITSGVNYGIFVSGLLAPWALTNGSWRLLWTVTAVISLLILVISIGVMWPSGLLQRSVQAAVQQDQAKQERGISVWQRLRGIKRPFVILILMHTFGGLYGPTYGAYLSAYIRDELGLSVALNGQVWSIIGIGGMVSGLAMGWLGDRIGTRRTLQLTYLCGIIAALLALDHRFPAMFLLAAVFIAFGFIPMYGQVAGYIAKATSADEGTFIFAVANVTHGVAGLLAAYFGGVWQNATGTFFWIYLVVLASAVIALLLTFWLVEETAVVVERS
ncbi:MAG: MFS transporter [Chloroflexota bacterium]